MRSPTKVQFFLFTINFIYSLNFVLVKEITPSIIHPFGLQLCRAVGGLIIFHIWDLFFPRERVALKDLLLMGICGFLGVFCNGLLFLKGIALTTPIHASLILILSPVIVLLLSAIFFKEKLTRFKILGIILGFSGAALLITEGKAISFSQQNVVGDLLIGANAFSLALYILISRKIMKKYRPLTSAKWLFSFGVVFVFPLGFSHISGVDTSVVTISQWLVFAFVIIFPTVIAFYLYNYSLKRVMPSVASAFIFFQPFLTTIIALSLGKDQLTAFKLGGGGLILIGVYYVVVKSRQSSRQSISVVKNEE